MIQTAFGHPVPVYNLERTVCDIIRCRNSLEMQTFQGALKQYIKRKDKISGFEHSRKLNRE